MLIVGKTVFESFREGKHGSHPSALAGAVWLLSAETCQIV